MPLNNLNFWGKKYWYSTVWWITSKTMSIRYSGHDFQFVIWHKEMWNFWGFSFLLDKVCTVLILWFGYSVVLKRKCAKSHRSHSSRPQLILVQGRSNIWNANCWKYDSQIDGNTILISMEISSLGRTRRGGNCGGNWRAMHFCCWQISLQVQPASV